jgi:hypothetical protein
MKSSICMFSAMLVVVMVATAAAVPTLSVTDIGLNGSGNREWRVDVAPDPSLFTTTVEGFGGSLAVELAFSVTGSDLLGASFNTIDWPNNNPGNNPYTGSVTLGAVLDLAGDTLFASLGSEFFTSGSPSEVFTLETVETGFTTVSWGGHAFDGYTGSRIAQAGANFDGYQGSLQESPPPPDFGIQYVRDQPFYVSGLVDKTALSIADVDTYVNTWNATAAFVYSDSAFNVINRWEPEGVPWTRFVTVGSEGADGMFTEIELGVDVPLPAALPNRYGYNIANEPSTPEEIGAAIATAAALKQYDPGAFVYIGLNTDASDAMEDLVMSNSNIDGVLGHRYASDNTSYANLEHDRALGLKHGKSYFRALRSFKLRPELNEPYDLTDSDFRFSAFSTLTYGYTGIEWFFYNLQEFHLLDPQFFTTTETYQFADRKSPAFEQVAALNQELFYIGEQTKHLKSTDVRLHLGDDARFSYSQPTDTVDWSVGAGSDPYITSIDQFTNDDMDILIGFFEHLDTQDLYFMVQNTLHTHADNSPVASLTGEVVIAFDFSSVANPFFDKTSIEQVSRLTGLWETIPLTSLGGDLYSLEFLLAGGDADLFRYSISSIPGDFDGDGDVDGADFLLWQQGLGTIFDAMDLDDWEANYGAGTLAGLNAGASILAANQTDSVPEPTALTLAVLGVCYLTARHRFVRVRPA